MDRWDIFGAFGVVLIDAGVWRLAGWPWGLIFLGVFVLVVYVLIAISKAKGGGRGV